ncbi:hypothetical protein ACQPZ2_00905 [Nocardia pseudovaccinii]|uniref:hypothetical protein n=1 Tax=Nocardia pseudovaccinii TaxID=189540 RepID=UPI003D8E9DCB
MRKVLAVVAAVLSCGVTITMSSCSSSESQSTAASATSVRKQYPDFLNAATKATIAYRDTIRGLDPCGYLDQGAINRIGTPKYFGADSDFSRCTVSFSPPAGPLDIDKISVEMGGMRQPGWGTPHDVGGTTVRTSDSGEFCNAYISFDDHQDIAFRVFTKGSFMGRGPKVDMCPTTLEIATAAIPHLSERPLRAESQRAHMNSKLAKLDPCAVLGMVGQDHPNLAVMAGPDPWGCAFRLTRNDSSTTQRLRYLYSVDTHVTPLDDKQKATTIGGFSANEKPGPRYTQYADTCEISVSTDPQPPVPVKDRDLHTPERNINIIEVRVDGGGCDNARATAEELVRLYNQLPG